MSVETEDLIAEATLPEVAEGHWTTPEGAEMAREYASKPRSWLSMAHLSDFTLANAIFLASRSDLDLIHYQTAAKERIRWLSAQVVSLRQAATLARDENA